MPNQPKKGKSGSKKCGRQKRKPSHMRYNLENRREKNKEKRAAKISKLLEKKALRKLKK